MEHTINIINRERYHSFKNSPKTVYKVNHRIKSVKFKRKALDDIYEEKRKAGKQIDIINPEIYVNNQKPIDGIFSPLFGADATKDTPVFTCDCHKLMGGYNLGRICPHCGTECRTIDADLRITGDIPIAPYHIMSYHGYTTIKSVIKNLDDIITSSKRIDKAGKIVDDGKLTIMDLYDDYDELIYPYTKLPRDVAFISHIPVLSARLRPLMRSGFKVTMLDINKQYLTIIKLSRIAKASTLIRINPKVEIQKTLNQIQQCFNEICRIISETVNGKSGVFRKMLASGRIDCSSRMVISHGKTLRPNEIDIPYTTAMVIYEDEIVNYLHRIDDISVSEAISMTLAAQFERDEKFVRIVNHLLRSKYGIWALINRNPTINESGILYCRVRKIHDDESNMTMSLPPDIDPLLAADYDGDQLTYAAVKDVATFHELFMPMVPTYTFIDRATGYFNTAMEFKKDYAAILSCMWDKDTAIDNYLMNPDDETYNSLQAAGFDSMDYDNEEEKLKVIRKRDKILKDLDKLPNDVKRRYIGTWDEFIDT